MVFPNVVSIRKRYKHVNKMNAVLCSEDHGLKSLNNSLNTPELSSAQPIYSFKQTIKRLTEKDKYIKF